jgi:hypothetical protein
MRSADLCRPSLILAILLAALSWFAFVWGLNLQFQVWPTFITG